MSQWTIYFVAILSMSFLAACSSENGYNINEKNINTVQESTVPIFFGDLGKTLNILKEEHPDATTYVNLEGFPDFAAGCLGKKEANYAYYFIGTQDGEIMKVMNEFSDTLLCAGFIAKGNVLFPEMQEEMSIQDFLLLLDISDYDLIEEGVGAGWLYFEYMDMFVSIDISNDTVGNAEIERMIKNNYNVSIVDRNIEAYNFKLTEETLLDY